jgi:Phospholipase_D-nuclease N-terminal
MRYLPVLLLIGLEIFALIDCIQTSEDEARHLPKLAWIILIVIAPLVGAVAWLFAGRPRATAGEGAQPTRSSGPAMGRSARPLGPDDDPDFLEQLRRQDAEHERMLKQWEEDLRRREEQDLHDESGNNGDGSNPPAR